MPVWKISVVAYPGEDTHLNIGRIFFWGSLQVGKNFVPFFKLKNLSQYSLKGLHMCLLFLNFRDSNQYFQIFLETIKR